MGVPGPGIAEKIEAAGAAVRERLEAATLEPDPSPVEVNVRGLHAVIVGLTADISSLEGRLLPVLRKKEHPQADPDVEKRPEHSCQLINSLAALSDRLEHLRGTVTSITDRLEL